MHIVLKHIQYVYHMYNIQYVHVYHTRIYLFSILYITILIN